MNFTKFGRTLSIVLITGLVTFQAASWAQTLGCAVDADCNDNDVCTQDTCTHSTEVNFCSHSSPNPVPAQCQGCCDTCVPAGGVADGQGACCAALDQFSCVSGGGNFTPGGSCNDNDVCEMPPPPVQCAVAPVAPASCRQMTKPNRHRLSIDDWQGKYDKKDRLEWGWRRGEATALADYGDPTVGATYALCMYDGNDNLVFASSIPSGPPWKKFKTAYSYTNPALDDTGIRRIALKSRGAAAGKASIRVVGAGRIFTLGNQTPPGNYPNLGAFPIAVAPNSIRMQLINSIGNCWEAHYQNRIRKNKVINSRISRFRAKND